MRDAPPVHIGMVVLHGSSRYNQGTTAVHIIREAILGIHSRRYRCQTSYFEQFGTIIECLDSQIVDRCSQHHFLQVRAILEAVFVNHGHRIAYYG